MFFSKAEDIFDVYQPIHFISRSIGLTSFSLKTEKGKIEASSTCLSLCIIISTTVLNLVFAHRFVTKTDEMWIVNEKILPKIFIDAMYFLILSFSVQTIILQVWTFCTMNSVARILNLMMEIDNEMSRQFRLRIDYTKQRKCFLGLSLFWMIFIVVSMVLTIMTSEYNEIYKLSIPQSVSMWLCMSTSSLLMCQFYYFIWSAKMRFRKLNSFVSEKSNQKSYFTMKEKLKKVANIHDLLVDVTQSINKCYGVPVSLQTSGERNWGLDKANKSLHSYCCLSVTTSVTLPSTFLWSTMSGTSIPRQQALCVQIAL